MTKYEAECILDRRIEKNNTLNSIINDIIAGDKKEIEETGISFLLQLFEIDDTIQIFKISDFENLAELIGEEILSDNERHQEYIRYSFWYREHEVMCLEDKNNAETKM